MSATADPSTNTGLREALEKLIDDYFAPWGSWKTAWWEAEVSDDVPFGGDNLLREIRRRLSTVPSGEGLISLSMGGLADPTVPSGEVGEADETGWLIETIEHPTPASPTYFAGVNIAEPERWPYFLPTKDHREAIRFCREQDALNVIRSIGWAHPLEGLEDGFRAVEHRWCGPVAPPPSVGPVSGEDLEWLRRRLGDERKDPADWPEIAERIVAIDNARIDRILAALSPSTPPPPVGGVREDFSSVEGSADALCHLPRHSQAGSATPSIRAMVDRFLSWRLPADFAPDNGISYQRPNYHPSIDATPTGTNLFSHAQAEAMVRHIVGDAPADDAGETFWRAQGRDFDGVGQSLTESWHQRLKRLVEAKDYRAALALLRAPAPEPGQ